MEAHVNVQKCPEVPAEERTSHEIVKQILKLRWIGRKHDADQLLAAFGRPGPRDSVRWSVRRDQLSGEPT